VPNLRGNHTKSSRTCGSFVRRSQIRLRVAERQLCPEYSPVGCSADMVVSLWNELKDLYKACDDISNCRNLAINTGIVLDIDLTNLQSI